MVHFSSKLAIIVSNAQQGPQKFLFIVFLLSFCIIFVSIIIQINSFLQRVSCLKKKW